VDGGVGGRGGLAVRIASPPSSPLGSAVALRAAACR